MESAIHSWGHTHGLGHETDGAKTHSFRLYTYAHNALVPLIAEYLEPCMLGRDSFDITGIWGDMLRSIRNLGRVGMAPMAISAAGSSTGCAR